MENILIAILRKIIFVVILWGCFKVIDNFYFKSFDTDETIKENPIAISILLGMFFIALALA